jgi:hypothetical protein
VLSIVALPATSDSFLIPSVLPRLTKSMTRHCQAFIKISFSFLSPLLLP